MINRNKFHHVLCMVVFGCDDNGQIEYPSTPEEYIQEMKKKGVKFSSEDYSLNPNCSDWVFANGKEPVIESYHSSLIDKMLNYL